MEGRPLEERELVRRAQSGDERAFESLIQEHKDIAFRVAYVIAGNRSDAEDAAQEAVFKTWRSLGRFRLDHPFRPWFLRIVGNEARNRRRSAGRRERLALRAQGQLNSGDAASSPEGSSPEKLVVDASEAERLVAAVEALPDDARAVISCRFLLSLSEAETAAVLGLRQGTVKSRTARALARLRESYD